VKDVEHEAIFQFFETSRSFQRSFWYPFQKIKGIVSQSRDFVLVREVFR